MMRKNKKLVEGDQANEWSKSGSFVNKPQRGWLHPDAAVMGPGVVYSVEYLGCIEVRQSMRTLDFEMRTLATKEAIWRVLAATGESLPLAAMKSGRKKPPKDVARILGDRPNLQFTQSLINLTISTASLTLVVTNTGQFIANHQMQSISFASGGDPDTIDYVAYVAKDSINNRACHVLKCADGLAQDVINTIGQAFELRFKEYLKNPPKAVAPPDRTEPLFHDGKSRWGDDEPEYYNELPGKQAPESGLKRLDETGPSALHPIPHRTQDYVNNEMQGLDTPVVPSMPVPRRAPRHFEDHNYVNTSISHSELSNVPQSRPPPSTFLQAKADKNAVDANTPPMSPNKQSSSGLAGALALAAAIGVSRDQPAEQKRPSVDAFDMRPFGHAMMTSQGVTSPSFSLPPPTPSTALHVEPWFHGSITRNEAEHLLSQDGDFLVRESSSSKGQFVLSGLQDGQYKHLLLVDPNGVVRTKDRKFDSVSHLISYHRDNNLPIVSFGSVLLLRQPVIRQIER